MFARVTFSQVSLDDVDEAISFMEKSVYPLKRQQKVFKSTAHSMIGPLYGRDGIFAEVR